MQKHTQWSQEAYPQARAVSVSPNNGESIPRLVAATHSKGNYGGEVVDDKILHGQTYHMKSKIL